MVLKSMCNIVSSVMLVLLAWNKCLLNIPSNHYMWSTDLYTKNSHVILSNSISLIYANKFVS